MMLGRWERAVESAELLYRTMRGLTGRLVEVCGLVPDDPDAARIYRRLAEEVEGELTDIEGMLDQVVDGTAWADDQVGR